MLNDYLFSLDEIEKIKNSNNERIKYIVDLTLKRADSFLEKKAVPGDFGRIIKGETEILGFAYYFTGDKKYFEKARETMLTFCEAEFWNPGIAHGGSFKSRSEQISALSTVLMSQGYALFGDLLTSEEREKVINSTYEKGIMPIMEEWVLHDTRIHALDTMGHNFWIAIVSNAAMALTIMKDLIPNGAELLEKTAKCTEAWFKYQGNIINCKPKNNDNGGYWEGVSYFDYSVYEYCRFASIYRRAFGKHPFNDEAILKSFAKFFFDNYYPSSETDYWVNFGDCSRIDTRELPTLLLRYGFDMPELRWFVNQIKVFNAGFVNLLLVLINEENKEAKYPDFNSGYYSDIGLAYFRESFKENSTLFAVKSGDTFNHCHADAGNFILFKNGNPDIIDSGTPGTYSHPCYQGYFVQSKAHNVVLFNEQGQDYRDNYKNHAHNRGRIPYFKDENGFRYALADCSGPMSRWFRKHHRHFLWIDNCILIYDDIECYENGVCNFLLHEEVLNESSFKMLTPCSFTLKEGYTEHHREPNCQYKSYNLETDSEGHAKFVSMLCFDENIKPTYEKFETYIKVTYGDKKFFINLLSDGKVMHNNCIIAPENYETDAIILADNNGKSAVVNGSIVRKDNETVFGSWNRIFGYVN